MLLHVPSVLSAQALAQVRAGLDKAGWGDGRMTAGPQSGAVKQNLQLPEDSEEARLLGDLVLKALDRSALFLSAALPARVYPPLFNKYGPGHAFGDHIDNAIRGVTGTAHRIRTDVSATLFLSEPDSYDGGELVIGENGPGFKLPAGDMILYPATSVHRVTPVTRGARLASFFWVQSLVKDAAEREMLFTLDRSVQALGAALGANHAEMVRLTGLYHNLVRKWAAP